MTAAGVHVSVRSERLGIDPPLSPTPRQMDALRAYAETGDYREAALRMGISIQTYKNHMTGAYQALDVTSGPDAFRKLGWLRPR